MKAAKEIAGQITRSRPFRVSVEGNIGSGKSSCINHFARLRHVEVHPEPLAEWRDVNGHNLLGLMYSDLKQWTFTFQHYVHLSRLKIQTSPPRDSNVTVKMFERSVQNSRHCFVENARAEHFLSEVEYRVLQSWFDFSENNLDISLDLIVYLRSTPEVVWERMMRRGRSEESEVPLHYLQQVHCAYEKWLGSGSEAEVGCPVLTIDADQDLSRVLQELDRHSFEILGGNYAN